MILTLKAKWEKHSTYKGVQIWRRLANSGTSGGQWLAVSTNCKSLAQAKRQIDNTEACGCLHIYAGK